MSRNKAWFSDTGQVFSGSEPFFFDTAEFDWVKTIEKDYQIIVDEFFAEIEKDQAQLEPYMNAEMMSKKNNWKTQGLMFWGKKSEENAKKYPKTWEVLNKIPNLCAASFNLLEPGTTIKPHYGNTNAIIRCHLGLRIPAQAPRCGFRVGTETRSWHDGKVLMFCDAHEHTAWNNTDQQRYIMVLDIVRPEFKRDFVSIASRVLGFIYYDAAKLNKPLIGKLSKIKWLDPILHWGYRRWQRAQVKHY
ncbi:aspartyl/asparaginyl beta-hydroxylase domain-containing protein [Alteromonas sp. a30]|uniref:aspartyl/asparaginyl beta-hydroxylase domain-containing protein n=1 Tax=Alteromonas sp. a30 TaxID=2730917 RepID=UPI00227F78EA|nr:aspartyl/asparaginyl beta-hydroxylase domain-containing protein [Alteromonas sp. a30]MCY7294916.1 aspartyl/asparaginyl beta-hydroxylase domain-containing protein [Alteromonas sp. a30]